MDHPDVDQTQVDREEIQTLLGQINEAWLMGYANQIPGILGACFDDRMVIKGPDLQTLSTGKDSCIQSYLDFLAKSWVKACTLSTPSIEVTGDTAVATYSWQVTYDQNDEEHKDSGHDVFVFNRSDGRWRAVWRAVLPAASPAA